MGREAIPSWFFAIVVVRQNDKFLIVHERKHGQLWYLPAGRVEVGESFEAAACRETKEEAGIPIRVTGVLRIEHTPRASGMRMRVVFLAEPLDDTPPKSEPDDESLGARWVTLEELDKYPLRSEEVRTLFEYVSAGGVIFPATILQREGAPYRVED